MRYILNPKPLQVEDDLAGFPLYMAHLLWCRFNEGHFDSIGSFLACVAVGCGPKPNGPVAKSSSRQPNIQE